jgi:superfamily II DNA or RNA helicase
MQLRDYQQAALEAIKRDWQAGHLDALAVAATGAGKTQLFLRLLMDELSDPQVGRGLILAHRTELIDQPLERIRHMDAGWLGAALDAPRVGVVQAQREDYNRQLTIATVQSLNPRRLAKLLAHGAITHLVIDEAHHGVASSYTRIIDALREANPNLRHLGVTATPIRADGDGLAKVYRTVSAKISIADLVRQGWLVKPRWLAIATGISLKGVKTAGGDYVASQLAERFDTPAGRAIILQAFREYASDRRAIAFTASVQGAHDLAEAFQEAGYTAAAIDGTTDKAERSRILGAFRTGAIQIVCNCQVLTEGFDAPGTSCVLMCRPTKSDGLYIQCMGRGLRPANGKATASEDCLILDFMPEDVRNIVMAGDVLGVPKEQSDAVRALLEDEEGDEDELAQIGFTFDGEHFDYGSSPMEIIARQLDYLNASGLAWFPPTGIRREGESLTVGLGPGSDGIERILAIRGTELYGIARNVAPQGERSQPWRVRLIACEDAYAEAEAIAARWAAPTLSSKAAQWRRGPLSEGQARYLKRLAKGRLTPAQIGGLSKGEAAQWITHCQALDALDSAKAVEVSG